MKFLNELAKVNWRVAVRTYGSFHATLVGLMVAWWNEQRDNHWALEGGPSFGYRPHGKGGGRCDALLCDSSGPAIVLEVAGNRYTYTLQKIGHFFDAEYPELETLHAGILLAYAYGLKVPSVPMEQLVIEGERIIQQHHDKALIVVAINKRYDDYKGIRARAEYYRGTVSAISAVEIREGARKERRVYYQE